MSALLENMGSDLIKTLKLKAKQPDLKSLRELSGELKYRRALFGEKCKKILDLLEVDVQVGAITALAQLYDPPMRCFTFQDFQFAPTLEEFSSILGYPLEKGEPYWYLEYYPSPDKIAKALKVSVKKIESKGGLSGFSRGYLEGQALKLAKEKDWNAFIDLLALVIYGIVLFPSLDDFVDFAATDVFLAFKLRQKNPVPAVLADVYCTLNLKHEKKGGMILCCFPVLYMWLAKHVFKSGFRVETKSNREWAQVLANLSEKTILWYSRDQEIDGVIYQCVDFPNVPLTGTKSCINYNPALALRQLGYPMVGPPLEDMVTAFVLYDMGPQNSEMLKRVRRAWHRVIKKGKELGQRSCDAKGSYRQWLRSRVQQVKLPFQSTVSTSEEMPVQPPLDNEEVEKIKEELGKSEEEKKNLWLRLGKALRANKDLQLANTQKEESLERACKRAKVKEESRRKTQGCLEAANIELGMRRRERDKAIIDGEQCKELSRNAKIAERSTKRQLDDLKEQLAKVMAEYESSVQREDHQKEVVSEYQVALQGEREYTWELKNLIKGLRETIYGFKLEGVRWVKCFASKALELNNAFEDILELLERAEEVANPLSTPIEIYKFF